MYTNILKENAPHSSIKEFFFFFLTEGPIQQESRRSKY